MKRYNTPHRHRVIKTRLTEEEYAEFSERVTLCKMSQAEFIRQALIKSSIRPVITVWVVDRISFLRPLSGEKPSELQAKARQAQQEKPSIRAQLKAAKEGQQPKAPAKDKSQDLEV